MSSVENHENDEARRQTNGDTPAARTPSVGEGHSWHGFDGALPSSWSLTAPWRQNVQRRRTMLFDELAHLQLETDPLQQERAYLINCLLYDACIASQEKVGLRKWLWGNEIERAWARLREVEERIVDLLPQEELLARGAEASEQAGTYLTGEDKRVQHLEALRMAAATTAASTQPTALRSSIVEVLRASHARADQLNQEARYLRNRLIIASAFSLLFAMLIVLTQWRLHDVPFLTAPDDWHGSSWTYLVVIMLFGAVGALFTAIPAISKIPSDFGPFNLPLQQGVLKIVFGPLVAVTGLFILSANALQVGVPKTWAGVLLLAVVFGSGQQAVTRYVDQRAGEILLAAAPSSATK